MSKMKTRKQFLGIVFLTIIFTSSNIILSSAFIETIFPQISTKDTTIIIENFEDTTFKASTTNAFGWGTGTVTNTRNATVIPLDFYQTKNPLRDIEVQGRKVYAAGYNSTFAFQSLLAFNINDPADIRLASARNSVSEFATLTVSGDTLYGGSI